MRGNGGQRPRRGPGVQRPAQSSAPAAPILLNFPVHAWAEKLRNISHGGRDANLTRRKLGSEIVTKRLIVSSLAVAALSLATALFWASRGETQTRKPLPRPKLVIIIVIDQLRNDYLDRFRPYFVEGGFKRVMSGARFSNCRFDYVTTSTGPGHATLATGANPNIHGIVDNDWYDRALKRPVNCLEELNTKIVESAQGPGERRGASPQCLLGSTLGDELRLASNFQSRVISISLKDRGAILSGGHTANAAYWYQYRTGQFVSSTYYMTALPAWVAEFNDHLPAKEYCGKAWKALPETPEAGGRIFEEYKPEAGEPCPSPRFLSWFANSPFQTEMELKFAREALRHEKLGQGPATDMLTISLSANDFVGHRYGPYSPEVADMTLRTDRALAAFFADLDRMIGLSNVWIALSGDHGVAPPPRLVTEHKLGFGRFSSRPLGEAVETALSKAFGPGQWVDSVGIPDIYLSQETTRKYKLAPGEVEAEAASAALAVPGVHAAFTRQDIVAGRLPRTSLGRKVSNTFHLKRSGDVFVVLEPFAVAAGSETETSHGTPWSYDAQVPLILWGSAFNPGTYSSPCQPIDLAPTLAVALGLTQPSGATGTPLSAALAPE